MPSEHEEPMEPRELADPLELDSVDRAIRLNQLREEVEELGMLEGGVSKDCPPEIEEQFLGSIAAFERAPLGTKFDRLLEAGVELPEPSLLDDDALHAKLWEIIRVLATWRVYLQNTDHLSDRALYEDLWNDLLREVTPILPPESGWNNRIDVIGGGSEEDIEIGLRYYFDEEFRRHWTRDFPEDFMPAREDPPFDRDRYLPVPPEEMPGGPDADEEEDHGGEDGASQLVP